MIRSLGRVANLPEMGGNSPFKEYPSPFMHGIIAFVDVERWTATVEIHETGVRQYSVPIMSPYFFREKGQGAYFIPEVGSQCLVSFAYGQPFVLGFLPPVDPVSSGSPTIEDLDKEAGTIQASSSDQTKPPPTSYRNNRDGDMLPGDFCFKTRARNRLKIFTNGNILVEASKLCMRIYSKLKNYITDYCVNYTMNTPGGQINFTNDVSGTTDYKREIRTNVSDLAYSFVEKVGTEGAVYTRAINTPSGVMMYTENIDASGNVTLTIQGSTQTTVQMDETKTVMGKSTETVTGDKTGTVLGNKTETITGTMALTATTGLTITSTGPITVTASGPLTLIGTPVIIA